VKRPGAEPLLVKTYGFGESFGELALMYNCPRQASIIVRGGGDLTEVVVVVVVIERIRWLCVYKGKDRCSGLEDGSRDV